MNDQKLDSPSFHRNVQPIMDLLTHLLPQSPLRWLEIGSGSGQHIERLGREFPSHQFQPTEIEPENLKSIEAWLADANLSNVKSPQKLDVTSEIWPFNREEQFDVFSAFNVIHIAPHRVTEDIFRMANKHGTPQCRIFFYGPFRIDGKHTSDSNASFELWLKEKSKDFCIKDINDVNQVAKKHGFEVSQKHQMPASNFMMEFSRVGT